MSKEDRINKLTELEKIERTIITKYRKKIYSKFLRAIEKYDLISEGDVIAICISGGKDSFLLAKCMQEVQKHGDIDFKLKFIVMNPGFHEEVLEKIKDNSRKLGIDINIFNNNIFKIAGMQEKGSCYLCAKMRRGALYEIAENIGANKIALGHHFSDVIETTMLNVFFGSEFKTMMPKLKSDNFKGLELIRPLFLVNEEDIISWKNYNNLEFIHCACPISDYKSVSSEELESQSKRKQIKKMLKELKEINPNIEKSIFISAENINLNASIGWKKDGNRYSFLDEY